MRPTRSPNQRRRIERFQRKNAKTVPRSSSPAERSRIEPEFMEKIRQMGAKLRELPLPIQQRRNLDANLRRTWEIIDMDTHARKYPHEIRSIEYARHRTYSQAPHRPTPSKLPSWWHEMIRKILDPHYIGIQYGLEPRQKKIYMVVGSHVTPDKLGRRVRDFLLNQNPARMRREEEKILVRKKN